MDTSLIFIIYNLIRGKQLIVKNLRLTEGFLILSIVHRFIYLIDLSNYIAKFINILKSIIKNFYDIIITIYFLCQVSIFNAIRNIL